MKIQLADGSFLKHNDVPIEEYIPIVARIFIVGYVDEMEKSILDERKKRNDNRTNN